MDEDGIMFPDRAMTSFAQNLEDVILNRVFQGKPNGFYIDVGANDPDVWSVTKWFYDLGWSGINIEPGVIFDRLNAERERDLNLQMAASSYNGEATLTIFPHPFSGASNLTGETPLLLRGSGVVTETRPVPVRTLKTVFEEHCPACQIDFMSIDVEGHENDVILGNDWQKFRPVVVLVESTVPNSAEPSYQEWDPLLRSKGYDFVYFDGLNRFYLRAESSELAKYFSCPPCVFDQYELSTVRDQRLELQRLEHQMFQQQIEHQRQIEELTNEWERQLKEKTVTCDALSSRVEHLMASGDVPFRNILRSIPRRVRRRILKR